MKKITAILFLFLVVFPALAGVTVMALWNHIIPSVCGFASITFWQGVGLFFMSQILSGGIVLLLFLAGAGIHHAVGHRHEEIHHHWHNMTEEQRREFIERRRREHFGFRNRQNKNEDATK